MRTRKEDDTSFRSDTLFTIYNGCGRGDDTQDALLLGVDVADAGDAAVLGGGIDRGISYGD